MDGYRPSTYGDGFADVYDDWYADVSPPADAAAFVAARAAGLVVELGSGTARLAEPLRLAGLAVVGLDASTAMLARSRQRAPAVPVVAADMATPPLRDGVAGAVLVAYNTLFNLPTPARQRLALAEAARLLRPDGVVVVEAFVPGEGAAERGDRVEVVRLDASSLVLRVSRNDPESATVAGHHVELRDGEPVRLRPWMVSYTSPDGVDDLAAAAGLRRIERFADWTGSPFEPGSTSHVSVYQRVAGRR